jgi:hypothetical protein
MMFKQSIERINKKKGEKLIEIVNRLENRNYLCETL